MIIVFLKMSALFQNAVHTPTTQCAKRAVTVMTLQKGVRKGTGTVIQVVLLAGQVQIATKVCNLKYFLYVLCFFLY